MNPKPRPRLAALLALALLSAATVSGQSAREILTAAGFEGGLIVHLGCGDAALTASLHADSRTIVHGLDASAATIETARNRLRDAGLYGPVSVDGLRSPQLPYVDNLVNLLVVSSGLGVTGAEMRRVLAPGGVLVDLSDQSNPTDLSKRGTVKPVPADIDEWTHFLHGPDNNAVARDRVVGPPRHLQWIADPIHLRSHEHLNSLSALVSAGERIFTIIDEGAVASVNADPQWRLVARDAFNGLLLWKREIGPWEGHFRLFRSGPAEIGRRLVAVGAEVYVTLGYGREVAAFDAATGTLRRAYAGTEGAIEILCADGRLHIVLGDIDVQPPADPAKRYYPPAAPVNKGVITVVADSGRILWTRRDTDTAALMATTMAVSDGRLFFQNTRQVLCLDAASGVENWRADRPVFTKRLSWSAPTLVVSDGVVLSADGSTGGIKDASKAEDAVTFVLSDRDIRKHPVGDLFAFSAEDGRQLWSGRSLQGFCNPGDVFVVDGKIWAGADVAPRQALLNTAVDLRTGEVLSRRPANGMPVGGHTKCYRSKATERYLVLGDIGVEFVDLDDWSWNANPWVRGSCQYGVMPCNGLLYVPPDSCACRPEMRLHGFTAMAPAASRRQGARSEERGAENGAQAAARLEQGPAYDPAAAPNTEHRSLLDSRKHRTLNTPDWPTYRADAARTGRTTASVPAQLKQSWRTPIGSKLTSVTMGAGKVFVSDIAAHTLYALNAATGGIEWHRTVGAAVDSPPALHAGRVFFGARDGHVYCLRAHDGELVWRYRAAPRDERLVAMQHVESVWPVHGSVLIRDGLVWFAAGRSPHLDGGIRLCAVAAATGKLAFRTRIDASGPGGFNATRPKPPADRTPPMLPDILSASDGLVYMRWMGFDSNGQITRNVKPHLFSATGFLDDTWWHRTYWQYGTWMRGGFGGWPQAARQVPAARIMSVGRDALFGFGRTKYDPGNGGDVHAGHVGLVKRDYQDMGLIDYPRNPYLLYSVPKPGAAGTPARKKGQALKYSWRVPVPLLVRGMVLTKDTLFIAGPRLGQNNRGLDQIGSVCPGVLWAVSPDDGSRLAELELPATPVLDGMIAVPGRLVTACVDGSVCAFVGEQFEGD